ncbi:MAG: class I SAM-dependent methyltransferase [Brachymonas sp.]|jgi:hypothetical protein
MSAAPALPAEFAAYNPKLLQALHILTREGRLNQDSRRKLKQVRHLLQFIEPLLQQELARHANVSLVDHGAGKSYLGFLLYDSFFRQHAPAGKVVGIERRADLVDKSRALAADFGFSGMGFVQAEVAAVTQAAQSGSVDALPARIDVVTALHACDSATDDAIDFALAHHARHIVLVPCCQAEVAAALRQNKAQLKNHPLSAFWQHPIHTREFGSHSTNVMRTLRLQALGYQVTVTELVGWEHSMKNELIIASLPAQPDRAGQRRAAEQLQTMLDGLGLPELQSRFAVLPSP